MSAFRTHARTATASAERLKQHWTRCHRRIHSPVAEWRVRFKTCVRSGGRHFEHNHAV